jgi:trans-2-enoyl-CoA reductase
MALKTELGERKQDENVFDQMHRLLCGGAIEDGALLRLDNYELDPTVQAGIRARLNAMTAENFQQHMDYHGIRNELLEMHGFNN